MFTGAFGKLIGRNLPFGQPFDEKAFTLLDGLSNSALKREHFRYDPHMGVGLYCAEQPLGVKVLYKDPLVQDNSPLPEQQRHHMIKG